MRRNKSPFLVRVLWFLLLMPQYLLQHSLQVLALWICVPTASSHIQPFSLGGILLFKEGKVAMEGEGRKALRYYVDST